MTTKTLTIMEDVYKILLDNKLENESFSDVIRRGFSRKRKKKLSDFFGIISEKEGEAMLKDLKKFRERSTRLQKDRFKRLWNEDIG